MADHHDNKKLALTLANHLERDRRLDGWSPSGIGSSDYQTSKWVSDILSFSLPKAVPRDLHEIFGRAQAVMVYGCYHYPLFTLGVEELFRYYESLLRHVLGPDGIDKNGQSLHFASLIERAVKKQLISSDDVASWQAGRQLRNSTTHNESVILLGPNDAVNALHRAQHRTETFYVAEY